MSTLITLTAGSWSQVTNGETKGSIFHKGPGRVAYVQADSQPSGYDVATPTGQLTGQGENFPVFDVPAGEFIYAYAITEDTSITFTSGD